MSGFDKHVSVFVEAVPALLALYVLPPAAEHSGQYGLSVSILNSEQNHVSVLKFLMCACNVKHSLCRRWIARLVRDTGHRQGSQDEPLHRWAGIEGTCGRSAWKCHILSLDCCQDFGCRYKDCRGCTGCTAPAGGSSGGSTRWAGTAPPRSTHSSQQSRRVIGAFVVVQAPFRLKLELNAWRQ